MAEIISSRRQLNENNGKAKYQRISSAWQYQQRVSLMAGNNINGGVSARVNNINKPAAKANGVMK